MIVRLVVGGLLVRQGALGMSDLLHLARSLGANGTWQAWPLIGSARPMELALSLAVSEFTFGVFLFGGLLTRVMALGSLLLSLFALLALPVGPAASLAHAALLVASLAIFWKGGGSGTLDAVLGQLQRRSIERQAEREAERRAALQTRWRGGD